MKMVYIGSTASIIYTIKYKEPIKSTYDKTQDSFLHWKFAVAPCAAIALATHLIGSGVTNFSVTELLWTFSIYLEAIAILPQLIVLQRYREVENLTGNYIFFMGAYRFLYILNLPSQYREELQTSLGCLPLWSIANAAIRRLFLLLFQKVSSLVVSRIKSKCHLFSLTLCSLFHSGSQ
jgi:hypothetical protein